MRPRLHKNLKGRSKSSRGNTNTFVLGIVVCGKIADFLYKIINFCKEFWRKTKVS